MITLDRIRTFGGGSKPYDAEVLYIKATGGARINTGYVPQGYGISIDMKVYIDSYPSDTQWNSIFYGGSLTSSDRRFLFQRSASSDTCVYCHCGSTGTNANSPTYITSSNSCLIVQLYNEENSSATSGYNQVCVVNGVKFSGVCKGSTDGDANPIFIFATAANGSNYVNGRIYYFRVRNNGVLVRDMIPVRVGSVGYLYDKVSGQLFGNVYSDGSFSVGKDLVAPDNMLYWWDSDDPITYNNNGSVWEDRMQGLSPVASNPNKVNGLYELQNADYSPNRIFQFYMNTSQRINLPAAWKIEVECIIPSDRIQSKSLMPFDFGSLGQATHGFGLSISASNTVGVNYKPTSNNDSSLYGIASENRPTVQTDTLIKIEVGTERVNSSQVQLYLKYNGTKIYGIAPHNAVMYIKNWSLQNGYFGKGHTTGYSGGKYYLKSLKIYNNE